MGEEHCLPNTGKDWFRNKLGCTQCSGPWMLGCWVLHFYFQNEGDREGQKGRASALGTQICLQPFSGSVLDNGFNCPEPAEDSGARDPWLSCEVLSCQIQGLRVPS